MTDLIFPGSLILLWAAFRLPLANVRFELDFDNAHASFNLLLPHYLSITRGLVVVDLLLTLLPAARVSPLPVHCCLAGAVYGILFSVWIVFVYERYLHARYPRGNNGMSLGPSIYSASKMAMTLALGVGTVVFSVVGLVVVLA